MTTALAERPALDASVIEKVLLGGDLSQLKPEQRIGYYKSVCESLGLNPLTKPFDYLNLNGKLQLYARKDATEQLRKLHAISVTIKARESVEGCYVVTAQARMNGTREDESVGAVSLEGLKGEARANAIMKAETKAKRRVTLSICGLGMLDETEIDSIPGATTEPTYTAEPLPPAPDAPPAPAIELPEGATLIASVTKGQTTKGKAKWTVTDSAGARFTIWQEQLAGLALEVCQLSQPVTLDVKHSEKWGDDITAIHRLMNEPPKNSDLEPDPLAELTLDEIGF